jgi:hypothetical protein
MLFVIYIYIYIMRIFTVKIEKFQLRGNNAVCAGELPLLRGRAPAQLRRNIACGGRYLETVRSPA